MTLLCNKIQKQINDSRAHFRLGERLGAVLVTLTLVSGMVVRAEDIWTEPAKVADVSSGNLTEANVAWWGFDANDSTRFLQAALDSAAKKIVIPNLGVPWISGPLMVTRNDLEVFFEPGTLIFAKEGEFRGGGDCLFKIRDSEKIVFRGHGANGVELKRFMT